MLFTPFTQQYAGTFSLQPDLVYFSLTPSSGDNKPTFGHRILETEAFRMTYWYKLCIFSFVFSFQIKLKQTKNVFCTNAIDVE